MGFGLQLLCLATAAVFISLALAVRYPEIVWYRGASGVLHALYFAGAMVMLAAGIGRVLAQRAPLALALALLTGGWVKVAMEVPQGADTVFSDWLGAATVPQAHFLGAAWGTAFGLAAGFRRRGRGVSP
jgi:hypothetical protein